MYENGLNICLKLSVVDLMGRLWVYLPNPRHQLEVFLFFSVKHGSGREGTAVYQSLRGFTRVFLCTNKSVYSRRT